MRGSAELGHGEGEPPYPGRQVPFGSQDALGGELPLVVQEVHGRPEPHHLVLPSVFPSHVEHEAEQHHADAEAVVSGQVDRYKGAQALPEGPQHAHRAFAGRVARRGRGRDRHASARGGLRKGGCHRGGFFARCFTGSIRTSASQTVTLRGGRHRGPPAAAPWRAWRSRHERTAGISAGLAADRDRDLLCCAPLGSAGSQVGYSVFHLRVKPPLTVHGTRTERRRGAGGGRALPRSLLQKKHKPTCSVTHPPFLGSPDAQ